MLHSCKTNIRIQLILIYFYSSVIMVQFVRKIVFSFDCVILMQKLK